MEGKERKGGIECFVHAKQKCSVAHCVANSQEKSEHLAGANDTEKRRKKRDDGDDDGLRR